VRRLAVILLCGLSGTIAVGIVAFGSSAAPARPTYFQDVKPILDSRCAGCHYAGGIAPFKLTGYLDAFRRRDAIAEAVRNRRMPPWHADSRVRRYLYDPSLTNVQIDTLVRWAGRRAPRGDASRPAPALPSVAPRLSRVDVRTRMPRAYTPRRRSSADDYRCFVLPWTPDLETFVTGFNVRPGTPRQVHHIIVYLAAPGSSGLLGGWETEDARPGYGCYGGPSATGRQGLRFQFLAGWVPGSFGSDFARGTGIQVSPGSRLVLQVHYNLQSVERARPDRSTVELRLDERVERRAVYAPFVDAGWILSPQRFTIPARRKRITHTFLGEPRELFRILAGMDFPDGFRIHSVLPHMHRLGQSTRVSVQRVSGEREVLVSIRDWEFNWQREYHLAAPLRFNPGDKLLLRCDHGNRTRTARTWGEDSSDEMCIAFLYVSEP
jgi:Copper type II ascorbate-dependent monooxygenase, C-terminal domain